MSKYKLIQLTNTNIGAISAQSYLPLGLITRRLNASVDNCSTFQLTSTNADTLVINDPGYYKITYSATLTAGAAGTLGISLVTNQETVYTVNEEATAAEDIVTLTLVYVIRICPNCCSSPANCPVNVQFKLGDTALGITPNPSTSNLIVEKVY
jgi:hypothetical protein